ncbi:MAG: FAD-binding protein [Coriobacteriia bacterium]|nr:FAD-binding protein [Coriobacteriia bacterium]MBS5478289.1 FAD-binding protein [Coriobacteriia bacterium]
MGCDDTQTTAASTDARRRGAAIPSSTDVLIVGAGPAGIFCALGLLAAGDARHITLVERGLPVESRTCPKSRLGSCVGCDPCRITAGFSGAGAFSDGKLSLSSEVGGDLPELIGADAAQATIDRVDDIYLRFGADPHVAGVGHAREIADIRLRAIQAGLKLVDCPIRHLGTECARQIYERIEHHLEDAGVELLFSTDCLDLAFEDGSCVGAYLAPHVAVGKSSTPTLVRAAEVVVATGRSGADWLERLCEDHGIAHEPGPVDVGVRVEVRNEVMDEVNNVLYESKLIGYPKPFKDKVRTFCQNPGGIVAQETYDDGLAVVNGHSYKDEALRSANTNLAILCSLHFRAPFDQPIAYARKVGELANMLGAGSLLVQRLGDILDGKRTWPAELARSNVRPTLPDAQAGDITAALPYRAMSDILGFILAVDTVVPGFAAPETLLYAPELKFYSNRVAMDAELRTPVPHLTCLGDSSGWTRGLMMASVMGLRAGERLAAEASDDAGHA